jgi:hypothetical protein
MWTRLPKLDANLYDPAPTPACDRAIADAKPAWRVELFGCGSEFVLELKPGARMPNAFWRWTQYLAFGNRWIRGERA